MEYQTLGILLGLVIVGIGIGIRTFCFELFFLSFCLGLALFASTFADDYNHSDYYITPYKVIDTPKAIIVATSEGNFTYTSIEDRSVLTAKKFYLRKYKNLWGIDLEKKTLAWSN
jgi:hypothetical protein